MIFTAPLGLLALLAIPAIIAIHLLRRRFPARPVAGLFLWRLATDVPDGGRRIDRLPITRSLLLECLAALALALIVAGARLSSASSTEHLVVLLDDSASMGAVSAAGESTRDRAVRRVLDEVSRIGPRVRLTLVRSGERPTVIAGPAAYGVEAEPALAGWVPEARHHSLAPGLRLARELAGNSGVLMILSDATPEDASERLRPGEQWAALGVPLANVGITDAHRTVIPGEARGTLALTLRHHADAAASRVLRVTAGSTEVLVRTVDVPPGTSSVTVPLPAGLPAVRATLSDDALAFDNSVVLVEPRPQIVGVENHLPEGRGRTALDRALDVLPDVVRTDTGHLAFHDAGLPAMQSSPGVWQVRVGRPGAGLSTPGDASDFVGPFVLEKRHPLLQGVTLCGVVWTGAVPVDPAAVRPLVSAGDRGLIGVVPGGSGAEPVLLFNLDLARTNLIRSPDWPILISNVVEMRRRELPGPERWNYRVGEWVRVRLDRLPAAPLHLRIGDEERALPQTRLLEFTAPAPGGLLQIVEGEDVRFELAVNPLDETEGELRDRSSGTVGTLDSVDVGETLESGAAFDPLFWILLSIASASMLANWWLLAPRRVRT